MTRGVWKGPFVHPSLLKKVDKLKEEKLKGGWDSTWYFENLKKLNKSFKKDDENSKRYW